MSDKNKIAESPSPIAAGSDSVFPLSFPLPESWMFQTFSPIRIKIKGYRDFI